MRLKSWIYAASFLLTCLDFYGDDPKISSLRFIENEDKVRLSSKEYRADVSVQAVALLKKYPKFVTDLKDKYLGLSINQDTFDSLQQEICDFYEYKGQPFVFVSIPEQDFSDGVLFVLVEEPKLGEVRVKGNQYFSNSELASYIHATQGASIIMEDVLDDVSWLNQNPFRRTNALFVPGEKPGTADLELLTIDQWPYRVYTGADNTGTIPTQRDRIFMGFDFGKTIIPDSQLAYQFSCSPNWNRFYAHTLSLRVPTSWKHLFLFNGGYSQVEPSLDMQSSKEKGTAWQVDARYRIPWVSPWPITQQFIVGYDFKETIDSVKKSGSRIFKAVADINQFVLGYELGFKTDKITAKLQIEGFANPGGITTKNHTSDYEEFRMGAKATYGYFKLIQSMAVKFWNGWTFSYDAQGQLSTANLLPSEQFVLTGYNAVKGFEERVLSVDQAALLNVVLETPHLCISNFFTDKRSNLDELYFHLFFDAGLGSNRINYHPEHTIKTLGSIGPGMRYQFSRYVTARLDYGFQLWHSGFHNPTNSRYNFGVIISY